MKLLQFKRPDETPYARFVQANRRSVGDLHEVIGGDGPVYVSPSGTVTVAFPPIPGVSPEPRHIWFTPEEFMLVLQLGSKLFESPTETATEVIEESPNVTVD